MDYLFHSPIPIWLIAALSFNTFAFVAVMAFFEKNNHAGVSQVQN